MNTTMSTRQVQSFLELAEQKGLTPDRMTTILSSGVLADVLDVGADFSNREAVRTALKLGALLPETIILTIDFGQDLEAMIAAGNYNWRNNDITAARFPVKGKGIVEFEVKLVHLNRDISSDAAETHIRTVDMTNPWEPGKIEHVLAFGKQFPEEQRKYPIVGLGSGAGIRGLRYVPCLDGGDSGRNLDLHWRDGDWLADCRFLAVRKKISGS